jgi:hypothetical protein
MIKITILALTFCLVATLAGPTWAADIPGQKLTQDELGSITGKASPFTIPMSFFQNPSPSGATVFIDGQKVLPTNSGDTVYTLGGVSVTAGATFHK